MNEKLNDIEFSIFDTETTGLEPESGDRIIEIACVKLKGEQVLKEFSTLVNPKRQIPEETVNIHHINNQMLENAPLMQQVMPGFLEFIKGSVLCAYNAAFDVSFLKKELQLLNQSFPSDVHIIDILMMARKLLPGLERYSLAYVSDSFGIRKTQDHRALSDVYLSIDVFNRLKKQFREKGVDDFNNFNTLFGLSSPYIEDIRNQKISRIQEAMELKVNLKIKYISSQSAEVTERQVLPRQLKQDNNRYYLIGYCNLRKEERIFAVDGILHLEIV